MAGRLFRNIISKETEIVSCILCTAYIVLSCLTLGTYLCLPTKNIVIARLSV